MKAGKHQPVWILGQHLFLPSNRWKNNSQVVWSKRAAAVSPTGCAFFLHFFRMFPTLPKKPKPFLKTGVSNPNGRLQRFGAKGSLRATLGQVRSSSPFPILLLLSVFLFTAVTQALSCPCSCLAARAGAGNSKLPYRCQGLLQREGRLWLS